MELDVQVDGRQPEPVEVAANYVVAEALMNATKYAHATLVQVHVHVYAQVRGSNLHLTVRRRHRWRGPEARHRSVEQPWR